MQKPLVVAALAALFVANQAAASTQVSADKYRAATRAPFAARSDGIYCDASTYGCASFANGQLQTPLSSYHYVSVFEDFLGSADFYNVGVDTIVNDSSPWATKDTSSGGSPSYAISGDADDGQYVITLASTDEAETVTLYWADEQNIDSDDGPVIVFYMSPLVWAAAAGNEMVWGLASAQNDTLNSVTSNAWFYLKNELNLYVESDDGTTDDDDNDTGIDLVAATWYMFKIDCSTPTDCDFFYSATLGGDWTELLASTPFSIGADAHVQPFVQIMKSGTGTDSSVPSVGIDFINVYWKRS